MLNEIFLVFFSAVIRFGFVGVVSVINTKVLFARWQHSQLSSAVTLSFWFTCLHYIDEHGSQHSMTVIKN